MTTIFEANPTFTVIQAGESLIIEETFGEYRIDGCAVDELYLPGITKRIIVAVELINNKDEIKVIISEPDERRAMKKLQFLLMSCLLLLLHPSLGYYAILEDITRLRWLKD